MEDLKILDTLKSFKSESFIHESDSVYRNLLKMIDELEVLYNDKHCKHVTKDTVINTGVVLIKCLDCGNILAVDWAKDRYHRAIYELKYLNNTTMKVFGNSMLPILESGSILYYENKDEYEIDDIVLSKVKGRFIDAHKITKKDNTKGYMIANNRGRENGWTHAIFGRVHKAILPNKQIKIF